MEKKLNTGLSKLTNIPEDLLDKISTISANIIGEYIYESMLNNSIVTDVDIGIGKILFKNNVGQINLKFIPNQELEQDIKNIISGKKPTLAHKLEKSLSAKLVDLYKDFI